MEQPLPAGSLRRDSTTNALLVMDARGLAAYKARKRAHTRIEELSERINRIEHRLEQLEQRATASD